MSLPTLEADIVSMLQRFDRQSPDKLIRTMAEEFVRLHCMIARLETRIATMDALSAIADQFLNKIDVSFDYPERIKIDAANSSTELIGVHELEYASDGMPFRWTGPDRHFSIQFFVSRREAATFELRFGKFFVNSPVEQLRGFADGEEVLLSMSGVAGDYKAHGILPARKQSGGSVLTFVVPNLASPSIDEGGDLRLLGLLFTEFKVFPLSNDMKLALTKMEEVLPASSSSQPPDLAQASVDRGGANVA